MRKAAINVQSTISIHIWRHTKMSGTNTQGVGGAGSSGTAQASAAMAQAESDMDAINALNIKFQTAMNDKKTEHSAIQTMAVQN
jgi:hypothetical protein